MLSYTSKLKREIIVILDNIRSALNVGAILRTCDGLGVSEIYICGISPTPEHPKVIKTALGAQDHISWKYEKSTLNAIKNLQELDYELYAVEQTKSSKDFSKITYPDKVALIFGHEITGVSAEVLNNVDKHIEIPMFGIKNSFNVATTVGIIISFIRFSK